MIKYLKKIVHRFFRELHLHILRKKLKNHDFTIVASNCVGGSMYHDLEHKFLSPFIDTKIMPNDYLTLLKNLKFLVYSDLVFDKTYEPYPVGVLGGVIRIHFVHYQNEKIALQKWNERKMRINWNNLFIIFTDRDGCTDKNMRDFDNLPFKNKVLFTNKKNTGLKSAVYLPGFENLECVGMIMHHMPNRPRLKYYDQFDWVGWINKGE